MGDTHHTAAPATSTAAGPGADTQWRQGGVIGAGVGLALSLALSLGLAPTRFPDGGQELWTTRGIAVVAAMIAGAALGMTIGCFTPTDPATRHG